MVKAQNAGGNYHRNEKDSRSRHDQNPARSQAHHSDGPPHQSEGIQSVTPHLVLPAIRPPTARTTLFIHGVAYERAAHWCVSLDGTPGAFSRTSIELGPIENSKEKK